MPEPNWWEVEDTTPVSGGWSDYLNQTEGYDNPFLAPMNAPAPVAQGDYDNPFLAPTRPSRDEASILTPELTNALAARLENPFLSTEDRLSGLRSAAQNVPTYGDMEFMAADDGDFSVMQQYQQEIPHIPKDKSFFEQTWDTITDIAGKPLGKMVDALSWTSDRMEQVVGLAYWNDVPDLATRWEMGKLTYEMGGMPVTGWGSASKQQQTRVRNHLLAGKDIDEIIRENEGGWTDTIMKIILDPLNLVGGIPGLTKLPIVGGSKFALAMEKGLVVPLIGMGKSPLDALATKALERGTQAIDEATAAGEIGKFRTAHGWFKQLPTAKAEDTKNHMFSTFTGIIGRGMDPEELGTIGDALRAGTPDLLAPTYGPAAQSLNTRLLADVFKEEGVNLRGFKSLQKPVAESEAAWDALPTSAPLGQTVRGDVFKNAQQQADAFYNDLIEQAGPAIDRYFGVPDTKSGLDKIHAFLKQVLGVAYLNRPGFVMLNVMNNWFTRGFTLGFGRPGYTAVELAERGITADVFKKVATDTGQFSREWLTSAKDPVWKKGLMLAVRAAAWNDQSNRGKAFLKAGERSWNWLWNFDDTARGGIKGFIPRLPDELRARLPKQFVDNLEGQILSLKNEEGIARLAQGIMAGDPGISMEKYLLRMAGEQGLNPAQTRLFMELEEPLKLRINDVLRTAQSPDDVVREVDKVKASLLEEVHKYREFDALPDHPRRYQNVYEGKADFEAFIRQRQQTKWDAMERAMRALGANGDEIEAVRDAYTLADSAIDVERAKAWTSWYEGRGATTAGETTGLPTRLPKRYAKSSPRYNIGTISFMPIFESDLDKALFILAQTKRSRADAAFLTFAQRALPGKSEVEIRTLGQKVKDAIKTMAEATPAGGEIRIPAQFGAVTPARGTVLVGNPFPAYRNFRLGQKASRDKAVETALKNNPELARRLKFLGELEETAHNNVDNYWIRTFRDAQKVVGPQQDTLFTGAYKFAEETYKKELDEALRYLGVDPKPPAFALPGDFPQMGEMLTGRYSRWSAILDRVKVDAITDMAARADPREAQLLAGDDLRAVAGYVNGLNPYMKTARTGLMDVAKAHTDFVMLNYDNKMGIDNFVKHIYPYEFWPTRTAYNWMRRAWHRPGATGALAKLYDNYADMNRDLPERLKHSVKVPIDVITKFMGNLGIPVPGLPAWAGNDIYFDPIQIMFPVAQWSNDWADEEKLQTLPGRIVDWASRAGPGLAPWVTLPLGFSGALGKREDWISYQLSGAPFGLPGTRAQRAIVGFLATGKDDGTLDEDTKYRVLLGQGLPENRLREMLGLEPGEKWDDYRIMRMLANMTATRDITPEAAMDAMKMGKGKVWNKAKVLASQEAGLRALTGWAIGMPVAVYPQGEQIQRGIGDIREVFAQEIERTGNRSLWTQFYAAFPEYQPRQAAVASDDKRQGVLDTSLYWMKFGAVDDEYDAQMADLERQIRGLEMAGGLKTKEGRANRNALKDRQSALYEAKDTELAQLRTDYPKASSTPSVYDPPMERALKFIRNEYYDIKDKDYTALKAKREAFLSKLPGEEADTVALQREATAIVNRYRQAIRAVQERKEPRTVVTRLYEKRDDALELITREARKGVTREAFTNFIAKAKEAPTAESQQYDEAKRLMGIYQAMDSESAGDKQARRAFWASHALLEEYYGNDEPKDAVVRDYNKMWESYFALPEKSQARRDWVDMNKGRLNELALALGKNPYFQEPARPVAPKVSFAPQRGQPVNRYLEQARQVAAAGGR